MISKSLAVSVKDAAGQRAIQAITIAIARGRDECGAEEKARQLTATRRDHERFQKHLNSSLLALLPRLLPVSTGRVARLLVLQLSSCFPDLVF